MLLFGAINLYLRSLSVPVKYQAPKFCILWLFFYIYEYIISNHELIPLAIYIILACLKEAPNIILIILYFIIHFHNAEFFSISMQCNVQIKLYCAQIQAHTYIYNIWLFIVQNVYILTWNRTCIQGSKMNWSKGWSVVSIPCTAQKKISDLMQKHIIQFRS